MSIGNADDDFAVSDKFDLFCGENKFITSGETRGTAGDKKKSNGGNGADSRLVTMAGSIGTSAGAAAARAAELAHTAQEYGHKVSDVAGQAKDFVGEQVSAVSDKIRELQDVDLGELAEQAKDYARRQPGQAILISVAAGLVLGMFIRGRR